MKPIPAALLFGGGSGGSDPIVASSVTYDGTSSGLSSENVQDAIDEVNEKIKDIEFSASDITYENTASGLDATDVQDAIDEVNTKVNTLPKPMQYKGTLGTGGTIQTLPAVSDENNGYVYKVITDAIYALDSFYYKVVCRAIGMYRVWDCTKAKDSSYTDIIKQEILEPRGGQGPLTFDDTLKIGGPYNHVTITALVDGILYNGVTYNTGEAIFSSNSEYWTCSGIAYGKSVHAKVGDIFISNGTEWTYIPSGDEANSVAELSDTNISNLATGDVLVYDLETEKWKNEPLDIQAEDVTYDNATSGLTATDVNSAIDEVNSKFDNIEVAAENVSFENKVIGRLLPDNAQGVIDSIMDGYENDPLTLNHKFVIEAKVPSYGSYCYTITYYVNDVVIDSETVWLNNSSTFHGLEQHRDGNSYKFTLLDSIPCSAMTLYDQHGNAYGPNYPGNSFSIGYNGASTWRLTGVQTFPADFHSGASYVNYDNTDSGLEATDVQGAIDEVNDNLTNKGVSSTLLEVNASGSYTLSDNVNNYRYLYFVGIYNSQVMDSAFIPTIFARNTPTFLNYNETGINNFVCRARINFTSDTSVELSNQWDTFASVRIIGVK